MAKTAKKKAGASDAASDILSIITELDEASSLKPISLVSSKGIRDALYTGCFTLDLLLGGGYPPGRIIQAFGPEGSGKSTLMYHACAEFHRLKVPTLFFDCEASSDPDYMKRIGMKLDDASGLTRYYQPEHGTQIYLKILKLLKALPDVTDGPPQAAFIIDSIANMAAKEEIEEPEKNPLGLRARMHSTWLARIKSLLARKRCTLIAVNQTRMNIGVMFGCFDYTTRVLLADGSTAKIGTLVNQRRAVDVMSFDPASGKVVARPIVNWFQNGQTKKWLRITAEKATGGNGRSQLRVTPNHLVFTPTGERHACELQVGDEVMGLARLHFNKVQRSVAIGSTLGDGSLRRISNYGVQLRIGHGPAQRAYAEWKMGLFKDTVAWAGNTGTNGWGFDTSPSYDLHKLEQGCYNNGERQVCQELLDGMTKRAVAIWYMDDGTFGGSYKKWGYGSCSISVKSYSDGDIDKLAGCLEAVGLPRPSIDYRQKRLCWGSKACFKFHRMIAKYIHPSMEYKIHPKLRGRFKDFAHKANTKPRGVMVPVKVLSTEQYTPKEEYKRVKYDLEIEGKHTYIVDGVGVHNSPETTPGGQAWKFATDVMIRCSAVEKLVEVNGEQYKKMRMKTLKNKHFRPFQTADVYIHLGKGISKASDIAEFYKLTGFMPSGGKPKLIGVDAYGGKDVKFASGDAAEKSFEENAAEHRKICHKIMRGGDGAVRFLAVQKDYTSEDLKAGKHLLDKDLADDIAKAETKAKKITKAKTGKRKTSK
jgi:recombination protein RecA